MTGIQGQLLDMLERVADALGEELRARMVFVGGCSTAVLISDEITLQEVRATDDVDLIVDLAGMTQWYQLQEELQKLGFTVSGEDDVLCRLRLGELKVDFMPDDPEILGFSNRWYKQGLHTAMKYRLPSGKIIKHLTPPLFLATKFEAFAGRGNNDLLSSHDMEDVANVVDGRAEIIGEVHSADMPLRKFLAEQFTNLLDHSDYTYFLEGNIRGPEGRTTIVRERLERLANQSA